MGYSIHQCFIKLSSKALIAYAGVLFSFAIIMIYLCPAIDDVFDQFLWFMDSVCYFRDNYRLSVESCHSDFLVRCHDDSVTGSNFFRCQDIFIATRTICLNFDRITQLFCCIFQTLCRHICVGDPGRACSHCQNTISTVRYIHCLLFLCFIFRIFCPIHNCKEFFYCLCFQKILLKGFIH